MKLNGHNVIAATVTVPSWGAWYADVTLDVETEFAGRATIVLNDVTMVGTVLSGGKAFGRSEYRVVGGAGKLGKDLPRKGYANDAGVKTLTVLSDAMREAGEALLSTTVPADRVGPAWTRVAGPASRVLQQLAPQAWHVDFAGMVVWGLRAASTYQGGAARVTPLDRARRRLTLAAETIALLVPGIVVDGLDVLDVVHTIRDGELRTMLYGKGQASSSELLDAYRKVIDQLDPDRLFRGTYEFRVVTQSGNRLNLQPVLSSTGMPDLQNVPVAPGLSGSKSTLAVGSRVLVTWVNADPSRPVVVGAEAADGEGFLPSTTSVNASTDVRLGLGALPAARQGDLALGIFPIVTSQTKVLV